MMGKSMSQRVFDSWASATSWSTGVTTLNNLRRTGFSVAAGKKSLGTALKATLDNAVVTASIGSVAGVGYGLIKGSIDQKRRKKLTQLSPLAKQLSKPTMQINKVEDRQKK
jgi:hypothetical protein